MDPATQGYMEAYMSKEANFMDYLKRSLSNADPNIASTAVSGLGGAAMGGMLGGFMGGRGGMGPGALLGGLAMAIADQYGLGLDEAFRWIQKRFFRQKPQATGDGGIPTLPPLSLQAGEPTMGQPNPQGDLQLGSPAYQKEQNNLALGGTAAPLNVPSPGPAPSPVPDVKPMTLPPGKMSLKDNPRPAPAPTGMSLQQPNFDLGV